MGYQQFLMLILALLIIGVAVSVGLDMFNQNSRNINRQAIISERNIYAGVANAFYKAPVSLGGGGRAWDVDRLGYWLGVNYETTTNSTSSNNGIYIFSSIGYFNYYRHGNRNRKQQQHKCASNHDHSGCKLPDRYSYK